MRSRSILCAVLFACAFGLEGQQTMFKIDFVQSGSMVTLDRPELLEGAYVFHAWPGGELTRLPAKVVAKVTQLTGQRNDVVYQIDLNPSGIALSRDLPVLKNGAFQFHTWRAGTLTSVRRSDIIGIRTLTGDQAFWAEQRQLGEALNGNLPMQGTGEVIEIGTPRPTGSQGGRTSLSNVGQSNASPGISGAPTYGNWLYQGTPGTSDAYGPANANMSNGVPTMPAATDGGDPPQ